jgi:ubiquinone/menaquinone biosynthesis C-methylase UbiE
MPENSNDPVEHAYDTWADTYDRDENRTRDLDALVLRQQPLRLTDAAVLELGCGTGKNTSWLAQVARQVVALDFSEGMLSKARERISSKNVQFIKHDLTLAWPLQSESQDVVVGNLVLEHLRDLDPVFREAQRVLRSGGQLFLCELHPFRQLRGSQAHFHRTDTGERQPVTAFVHHVSDYINSGLSAGLALESVGDWCDQDAAPPALPRLFSTRWRRP